MQRPGLVRAFVLISLALATACGHKPPYRTADKPGPETLLEQTEPQLPAVAVSDARITFDRIARADLLMLAQADARFRASVTKAGNELVTLAFSEQGYSMRYKLDGIPPGYYTGPADPCAIEAVLGVPFSYEGLVALVLGGAPIAPGATVVAQKWDRKLGYEVLTLSGGGFVQKLWFGWVDGAWVFSGGEMWEGSIESRGRWLWSLEHDRHETVGGVTLPGRTRVRAPGPKRTHLIVINYRKRSADPPWAKPPQSPESGGDDGGGDDGGWESGDDGGWENDDEGWENDDAVESSDPPAESPAPPSGVLASVLRATQATPGERPSVSPVPSVFRVDADGLVERGDLCR